jgi:hypothetical protein
MLFLSPNHGQIPMASPTSHDPNFWAAVETLKRSQETKVCLAASSSDPCQNGIIAAHMIPRSQLQHIAVNGHVYTLVGNLQIGEGLRSLEQPLLFPCPSPHNRAEAQSPPSADWHGLPHGAYCRFVAGAVNELRELLRAVAAYASGGMKALDDLSARRNAGAIKALEQ